MSYRLTNWAVTVPGITPTQKLVLVVLAYHCNGVNGSAKCWPSMAQLSDLTGFTERTIQKALADLERRNLIARKLGSGRTTTVYRLAAHDSPNQQLDLEPLSERAEDTPSAASRGERNTPPGANEVHPWGEHHSLRGEPRSPGTGKEQGREQGGSERDARSCTAGAPAHGAGSALSLAPNPSWQQIAAAVRPDLPDPATVRRKFEAHYRGHTFGNAADEARAWELWLLRERQNPQKRYTEPLKADREPGSFLANIPSQADDLTAEYKVFRDEG